MKRANHLANQALRASGFKGWFLKTLEVLFAKTARHHCCPRTLIERMLASQGLWLTHQVQIYVEPVRTTRQRMIAVIVYMAYLASPMAGLLSTHQAQAAPIADPRAELNFMPGITVTARGVPVVYIAEPNTAGISFNQFKTFDIDLIGLILNNSRRAGTSLLGGAVGANPNLVNRSANLIIAGVNSAMPSTLAGAIEIFGDPASVVIANPNGILCTGCGSNNAPNFTLTTGTPLWRTGGSASAFEAATGLAYEINGGRVDFAGLGLEATRSRVDIIAASIGVDAPIRGADQLKLIAGKQTVEGAPGALTPTATTPGAMQPENATYAFDASRLGAITAGTINIIVSGDGFGVRSDAAMAASSGDLTILANGDVRIREILAHNNASVGATGQIDITQITGLNDINLSADGDITSRVRTEAGNDLNIQAGGNTALSGQTTALKDINLVVGRNIELEGALRVGGATVLTAGGNVALANTALNGDLNINAGGLLSLNGALNSQGDLDLTSKGSMTIANDINIAGRFLTQAGGDLSTHGVIQTTGDLNLHAGRDLHIYGALASTAGNINAEGGRDTRTHATISGEHSVHLSAGNDLHINSPVQSAGTTSLTAAKGDVRINEAVSSKAIDIHAGRDVLVNAALNIAGNLSTYAQRDAHFNTALLAGGRANVTAGRDLIAIGNAKANETLSLHAERLLQVTGDSAAGSGDLLFTAGQIQLSGIASAGQHLSITQTQAALQLDQTVVAGGKVTLKGDAVNTVAAVQAGEDLTIIATQGAYSAKDTLNATGNIAIQAIGIDLNQAMTAGKTIELNASAGQLRAMGPLAAGGTAQIAGDAIRLEAALATNGAISLNSATSIDTKTITTPGKLTINANADVTIADVMNAGAGLHVQTQTGNITVQAVATGGSAKIQADKSVTINAAADVVGTLEIVATQGSITASKDWTANGGIKAAAGLDIKQTQNIASDRAIELSAGRTLSVGDSVTAVADLTLQAQQAITVGGDISAAGAVKLSAQAGAIAIQGVVSSDRSIAATAEQDITIGSSLHSVQDTVLTAGRDININDLVAIGDLKTGQGKLTMTAGRNATLASNNAVINDLTIQTTTGAIIVGSSKVGGALNLNAQSNVTATGSLETLGDATLNAQTGSIHAERDIITAGQLKESAGQDIRHNGHVGGNTSVVLTAGRDLAITNDLMSQGVIKASATNDVSIAGITYAGKTVALTAQSGSLKTGNVSAQEHIDLKAGQDILATGSITAGNPNDRQATVVDVVAHAGGAISVDGSMGATRDIVISAGGPIQIKADVVSQRDVQISTTAGAIDVGRDISALNNATLTATETMRTGGDLLAGNDLIVRTGKDATIGRDLAVGNNLQLNAGQNVAVGRATLVSGDTTATVGGLTWLGGETYLLGKTQWQSKGGVTLNGPTYLGDQARFSAEQGNIDINAALYASKGLSLAAKGQINLRDQTTIIGVAELSTQAGGGINNTGTLSLNDGLTVNTAGAFNSQGKMQVLGDLNMTAASSSLTGDTLVLGDTKMQGGAVTLGGNFIGNRMLSIASGSQVVTTGGHITAVDGIEIKGGAYNNSAQIVTNGDLSVVLSGHMQQSAQGVLVAEHISLSANSGDIGGKVIADKKLDAKFRALQLAEQSLIATAEANFTIDKTITNNGAVQANNIHITGPPLVDVANSPTINNNGVLLAKEKIVIKAKHFGQGLNGIAQSKTTNVDALAIDNKGVLNAETEIALQAAYALATSGQIRATTVTIEAAGVGNSGTIIATNRLGVHSNGAITNSGTLVSTAGELVLTSTDTLQNSGTIRGEQSASINANGTQNGGSISSAGKLTVNAGDLQNSGTLYAGNALTLRAGSIHNKKSEALSGCTQNKEPCPDDQKIYQQTVAQIGANQGLTIDAGSINNEGLIINADGAMTITLTGNLSNTRSVNDYQADANIAIKEEADKRVQTGGIMSAGTLDIKAANATNQGVLTAAGGALTLTLAAGGQLTNKDKLALIAGEKVTINADTVTNTASATTDTGATIASNSTLDIKGRASNGVITNSNGAALTANGDINISGYKNAANTDQAKIYTKANLNLTGSDGNLTNGGQFNNTDEAALIIEGGVNIANYRAMSNNGGYIAGKLTEIDDPNNAGTKIKVSAANHININVGVLALGDNSSMAAYGDVNIIASQAVVNGKQSYVIADKNINLTAPSMNGSTTYGAAGLAPYQAKGTLNLQSGKHIVINAGEVWNTGSVNSNGGSLTNTGGQINIFGDLSIGALINKANGSIETVRYAAVGPVDFDSHPYFRTVVTGSGQLCRSDVCDITEQLFSADFARGNLYVKGKLNTSGIQNLASTIIAGGGVSNIEGTRTLGTTVNQDINLQIHWNGAGPISGTITKDPTKTAGQAIIQAGSLNVGNLHNAGVISVSGDARITGHSINGLTDPRYSTVIPLPNEIPVAVNRPQGERGSETTTEQKAPSVTNNGITYDWASGGIVVPEKPEPRSITTDHGEGPYTHQLPLPPRPSEGGRPIATVDLSRSLTLDNGGFRINPAQRGPPPGYSDISRQYTIMTRTSDVDSEGNSSYARTIVTIPPPAQLVSPVAAVTRDTGLFDLANFPRAPSGALQVADKLHLDGGHFINTGFIQADTIHLDQVDLVNTRRLADVHYTEYQSRRQWTLIGGESVQPGGFMSASHWIIDNKPTQIGEAANGDPIYLDGGKITCNSCNFDIPGFNDEHLDSFFRLLKSTYGDHFELNRLLDNLHLQSIGKAPWHQRHLNVILVVAAIVLSVLCYETCVPIVADWLKAIGATGAKALSPYVVAALGTLSMQFIAAAATGNWDLSSILQAVILTVVTAGLTYGITGAVSDAVGVDLYAYGINNASGVVSNWGEYAAAAGTRAVISSGVSTVVNGGDLKDAFLASFVSNLSPGIANAIGDSVNTVGSDGSTDWAAVGGKGIIHAVAGCALAAAQKHDCGAGAIGAGIGELTAAILGDGFGVRDRDAILLTSRLSAVAATALAGKSDQAATADFFADNAVKNNYLTHAQVDATAQKLKTCGADKDCREQALAEASRLSVANDLRLLTCKSTNNCEQLQAEYRTGYRAIEGLLDSGISPDDIGRLYNMEDMAATMMRSGLSQKYCETPQCIERAQHLSGIAKGLLALHPVGLVAGAGAAGYLLTTEIIQTGVADTAIKVAQGIADLPAHVVAGLTSSNPAVRGEALVVALTFPAVVGAVTAKLGSAGLNVLTSKTEAAALRGGGVKGGVNLTLLNELTANGVKFTPENVIATARSPSGQVVFLETGDSYSGLTHIVQRHATDFANIGISEAQIPSVVMRAVSEGNIVGYQGRGTGRPIYEVTVNGQPQRISITTGGNGYIVGANPAGSAP